MRSTCRSFPIEEEEETEWRRSVFTLSIGVEELMRSVSYRDGFVSVMSAVDVDIQLFSYQGGDTTMGRCFRARCGLVELTGSAETEELELHVCSLNV